MVEEAVEALVFVRSDRLGLEILEVRGLGILEEFGLVIHNVHDEFLGLLD